MNKEILGPSSGWSSRKFYPPILMVIIQIEYYVLNLPICLKQNWQKVNFKLSKHSLLY